MLAICLIVTVIDVPHPSISLLREPKAAKFLLSLEYIMNKSNLRSINKAATSL